MANRSLAYTVLVVFMASLVLLSIISSAYSGVVVQALSRKGVNLEKGALHLHVYPDGRFYIKYGNGRITYAGPTTYLSIRVGKYVFTNYNGMLSLSWLQSPTKIIGNSAITVWVINNTLRVVQNLTLLDKAVLIKLKLVGGAPSIDTRYVIDIVSSTSRKPLLIVGYDTQKYTNYLRDGMSISQIYTNTIINGEPAAVGVWWDKDNTAPEKAGTAAWGVATHGGWAIPNATNTMTISTAAVLYYKVPSGSEISFKVGILPEKFAAKLIEVSKSENPFLMAFNRLHYYPGEIGIIAVEDKAIYDELLPTSGTNNTPSPATADNVEITGISIEEGTNLKNIMLTHDSESLIGFAYATFKAPVFENLVNHPTQVTMLINVHSDTLGNYILKVKLNLTKNLGYVTVNNKKYYIEASTNKAEDVAQDPLSRVYIIDSKGKLLKPTDPIFSTVFLKIIDNILPKLGLFNKEVTLNTLKGYRPPNMSLFYSYITHEDLYNFIEGTHDVIGKLIDTSFKYLEEACNYMHDLLSNDPNVSPQAKEEEILADTYTRIILDAINLKERFNAHSELTRIRVLGEFTLSSIELLASGYLTFIGLKDFHNSYIRPTKISQILFRALSNLKSDKELALFTEKLSSKLEEKLNERIENAPEVAKRAIEEEAMKELINPLKDLSEVVSKEHLTLYSMISDIYRLESIRLGILLIIKGVYTQVLAKYHEEGGSLTRNSPLYSQSKAISIALSYAIKKLYDDTCQYRNLLLLANLKHPYLIVIAEEQLAYKAISKSAGGYFSINPQTYGIIELTLSSIGMNMYAHLVGADLGSASGSEDFTSMLLDALAESAIDFCYAVIKSIAGEVIKEGIKTAVASVLSDAVASALGPIFIGYEIYNWLYDALGIGDMINAYNNSASLMGIASRIPDAYDASLTAAYQINKDNLDCSAILTLVAIRIFKLSIEFEALDVLEEAYRIGNPVKALANVVTAALGNNLNDRVNQIQGMKDEIRGYIYSLYSVTDDAFVFISKVYNIEPLPQRVSLGENLGSLTIKVNGNSKELSKEITLYTFKKDYEWYTLDTSLQEASRSLVSSVDLYMIKQYWARNVATGKDNMYLASTITFKLKDGSYIIVLLPSLKNNLLLNTMSTYRAYSARGDIYYIKFSGSYTELLANTPIGYVAYEQTSACASEKSDTDLGWMGTELMFDGHNLPVIFRTHSLPAVIEEQIAMNFHDLLNKLGLTGIVLHYLNVSFSNRRLLYVIDEIKPAQEYMLAGTNYDLRFLGEAIAHNYGSKVSALTSLASKDIKRIINADGKAPVPGINAIRIPVIIIKSGGVTYFKLGITPSILASILKAYADADTYTTTKAIITLEYFKDTGSGSLVPASLTDLGTSNIDKTLSNYSNLLNELRIILGQTRGQFMLDLLNQLLTYYGNKLLFLASTIIGEEKGGFVLGLTPDDLHYLSSHPSTKSLLNNLARQQNIYVMMTVNNMHEASKALSDLLTVGVTANKVILSLPSIANNYFIEYAFSVINILIRMDGKGIYATLIGLNDVGLPPTANSTTGKILEQMISVLNHRHILPTSDSYASIEFYDLNWAEPPASYEVNFKDGTLLGTTMPVMFRGGELGSTGAPKLIAYVLGLQTLQMQISQIVRLYESYSEFAERKISRTYYIDITFSSLYTTATINIKITDQSGNVLAQSSSIAYSSGNSGYSKVFILISCYYDDDNNYHIYVVALPLRENNVIQNMIVTGYYGLDVINEYLQDKGILATIPLTLTQEFQEALRITYDVADSWNIISNVFQANLSTSVNFTIPSASPNSIVIFSGIMLSSSSTDTTLGTINQYISSELMKGPKNGEFILDSIYTNDHYLGLSGFNGLRSDGYNTG